MNEYLLLVRHGKVDKLDEIKIVAARLRDVLAELPESDRPCIRAVEYAVPVPPPGEGRNGPSTTTEDAAINEPKLTAQFIAAELGVPATAARHALVLGPERLGAWLSPEQVEAAVSATCVAVDARLGRSAASERSALMLVGHEPAIDWFLAAAATRKLALSRAELLCLTRERGDARWSPWWALTPDSTGAISELQQKVASKMLVISVLAGFVTALLAEILLSLPKHEPGTSIALGAVALYVVALTLLVAILFAYDRLGMPVRYWSTPPSRLGGKPRFLRRPPSSAAWVLYEHSVRLWRWVAFALLLVAGGTIALTLAVIWKPTELGWGLFGGTLIVTIVGGALWWRRAAPRLGTED